MLSYQLLADALRFLSVDAIEVAKSGHPGMPLGLAEAALVLWQDFLQHNPNNSQWYNRDRVILSNGHGSMLLYALLHLTGYPLTLEDLQKFRKLHSLTPGHPEITTPGVEAATGPLGQGLANAVGMALAEKLLAKQYNRPNFPIVSHYTYCFVGDGCLMEGISHEAASLAGTWQLNKLIVLYDSNNISIDGEVQGWFTDNTAERFRAYNWQVITDVPGHNIEAIRKALSKAQQSLQPVLIILQTTIGQGSSLAGTSKVHGAPLGSAIVDTMRKNLNWADKPFLINPDIYQAFCAKEKGQQLESAWQKLWLNYQQQYPELAKEFSLRIEGVVNTAIEIKAQDIATRRASQLVLEQLVASNPALIGGSADLTESNLTKVQASTSDNYLHYGVREFAMAAIMNGLALHKGFIPYGGTFLVFADYARNAIRMSAIMQLKVIYVLTHDSIGLGEDGPTHQPIEHLSMLRSTPNLMVWRPADVMETKIAWQMALNYQGPTVLALTRQVVPSLTANHEALIKYGGYVIWQSAIQDSTTLILLSCGSELQLALQAAMQLQQLGRSVRVVSIPCHELFLQQSKEYQLTVLPNIMRKRLAIEAGHPLSWQRFVGLDGIVMGLETFGLSAPYQDIYREFGLTVEEIITKAEKLWQSE